MYSFPNCFSLIVHRGLRLFSCCLFYKLACERSMLLMLSFWYAEGVSVLFLPQHMQFVIPLKFSLGLPLKVFSRITLLFLTFCAQFCLVFFIHVCLFDVFWKPISTDDALESLSSGFVSSSAPPKKTDVVSSLDNRLLWLMGFSNFFRGFQTFSCHAQNFSYENPLVREFYLN